VLTPIQTGVTCQWTTDSQRLILEHFDMICGSPSYIYSFALPISPSSSWLHQYYSAEFSQEIKVVKGVSAGWGTCFRTVPLDGYSHVLTCWKDTVAVGLHSGCIVIFNAITGIQMGILSGHSDWVKSLVFSPDGTSLVSCSSDKTIKLWDMQTGGVVKTFQGHTDTVCSVSISADCTTIASGSSDKTIHLWNIQTGECHHIMKQQDTVNYIFFSPLDPKHLIFTSGGKICQWDIDGQRIASESDGYHITFSPDGTQLVVCNGSVVEVQSSDSKATVAKFSMPNLDIECCCISPDNRLVAVAAAEAVYVWDITSSDPHLLDTFIDHTMPISSLAFFSPSSLISTSYDQSVRFWQIGASSTDPVPANPKATSLALAPVKSITLQAKDGIAISSHSDGVVRIWDISTGSCKTSFQTQAKDSQWMDTCLTDGRLISVWCTDEKICIWDAEKGELLRTVAVAVEGIRDFRVSGDGSKVFCLNGYSIQAWSLWTGKVAGEVQLGSPIYLDPFLAIDSLRVWIHLPPPKEILGWDFGIIDSSPIELSDISQSGPHLDFIGIRRYRSSLPGIQDTVTKKVVFQLPSRLTRCADAQWDGQFLVVGYDSGEVLILECNHVLH